MSALDAAGLAALVGRLRSIATEMGEVLRRSSYSPNIKERMDASAAVFAPDGELLMQAEHIPVHLGAMAASVRAVISALGTDLAPGAQALVNDPFRGGTHLNDITVVAPVHADGVLVGWVANRAHHADVGGSSPGSMPADASEIFHEGIRFPPVLLDAAVRSIVLANSRSPFERAGDLDAQVGANVRGAERLAALAGAPFAEVLAYGERAMRVALAALPDGSFSADDVMDSLGAAPALQHPARIALHVRIAGDELIVDLRGSDTQGAGNVNAVRAVTESAVAFAVRSAVAPDLAPTGGALRPITIVTEPGSIVDALAPAAVGAGNVEVSQRIADVCLQALAGVPGVRLGAPSQGTMNNVLVGGRGWVYYETIGGGQGARPGRDGMSGVHTNMTNTRNTPVEALERAYPLRVRRLALRPGSGGAGRWRGGDGIERELEVLEDVTVSLVTERRHRPPQGVDGGEPGARGENWLLPGGDEAAAVELADKVTLTLRAGDVLRIRTPGGGGWARPNN